MLKQAAQASNSVLEATSSSAALEAWKVAYTKLDMWSIQKETHLYFLLVADPLMEKTLPDIPASMPSELMPWPGAA